MFTILLLINVAMAEEPADAKVVYKKETEIDFEALELEGELVKPQGALLLERRKAHFNPLIKLRKDWDTEMKASVTDI